MKCRSSASADRPPADDPRQRQPDIAKAQAVLGWGEPQAKLRDGLAKTTAHFNQLLREFG